jgi:polyisoprenoid-binding protein YceI
MKTRLAVAASLSSFILLAGVMARPSPTTAGPATPVTQSAQPSAYQIDSVHSSVVFSISHQGVGVFWGRFNSLSGSYTFDPASPEAMTLQAEVKADSVDTNNDGRDKHLRSPDFFNATEFPVIRFTSTKVELKSAGLFTLSGDLSLHGVTRPIQAEMKLIGAKDTGRGVKSGFETMFTIKRSDFGMTTYVAEGGLGDEVKIVVAFEGVKRE